MKVKFLIETYLNSKLSELFIKDITERLKYDYLNLTFLNHFIILSICIHIINMDNTIMIIILS